MKKNKINTGRSTCVVCGKVRYRSYLHQLNGLWVCNISTRRCDNNYVLVDGVHRAISRCTATHRQNLIKEITQKINVLNDVSIVAGYSSKLVFAFDEIVRPELTK